MSFNLLPGKTIVITGAATGIGRATAIGAAKNGANVVLHHLGSPTSKEMSETVSQLETIGAKFVVIEGDISDPEVSKLIVKRAVDTFGRIDALVSNAGICTFHPFLTLPPDLYLRTQNVNMNGTFWISQAVANQMKDQEPIDGERGCLVGISSISAIMGGGEQCHYCPTKAGIKSLMESCAIALGPYGIRCNSIMPGTIVTPMNEVHLENQAIRSDQERRVPLARLGRPDDVADAVLFMCSRLARYVNGTGLLVDGGMAISLQ
ncbi:putative glucose 1-dehydrogenase [Kockovaella imperatae]|uniref:Putative glucose 1-dehydrogenase n=1 Tax=Kockovaella imperatae TaxID=4999 RepID=A0A1Y1ULD6_9TREE|nr:putative glucose 1-dehydrogenase [Kockovaella imperatae]ORX38851.1 putative glucose 1-dehydrogenase [Kockovaella imperatae]